MSECKDKQVCLLLSEEEETERSEVTLKPVSESRSFAEKVKVQAGCGHGALMGQYVGVILLILSAKLQKYSIRP